MRTSAEGQYYQGLDTVRCLVRRRQSDGTHRMVRLRPGDAIPEMFAEPPELQAAALQEGRVVFRPHPRPPAEMVRELVDALGDEADSILEAYNLDRSLSGLELTDVDPQLRADYERRVAARAARETRLADEEKAKAEQGQTRTALRICGEDAAAAVKRLESKHSRTALLGLIREESADVWRAYAAHRGLAYTSDRSPRSWVKTDILHALALQEGLAEIEVVTNV